MKLDGNNLFLRLAVTLAIIFFSMLVMIAWWQMLFSKSFNYYVISEEKILEINIYKGIYSEPNLIAKLITDKQIMTSPDCKSSVCVKIPTLSSFYIINPEYEKKILSEKTRKVHMFFWETSFLILILIVTIGYMFWVVAREKKIQGERQEFLAMTTHELKHPVSVLSLLLESLQRNSLPKERIGEFIEKGMLEIKTLKKSLENILKLQELTFSKKEPVRAYNLNPYLQDFILNWQLHELNRENRIVMIDSGDENWLCNIDPKDLQIILNNLIENALLYSKDKIYLETGKDARGIFIQIKDSGLGFSEDDKKNFQKMFFRSRRHDIQNISGSGLGHYIIKKMLRKHSLNILLDSAGENKGSVFKLYIK